MHRTLLLIGFFLCLAGIATGQHLRKPVFTPTPNRPCLPAPPGVRMTTGYVTVPQDYQHPKQRHLQPLHLSVAVFSTEVTDMKAVPVIYLAGGPSGAAINDVRNVMVQTPVGQLLLRERPIITCNQRGLGQYCANGEMQTFMDYWDDNALPPDATEKYRIIAARMRKEGLEPNFFTTEQAAQDIQSVLKALGYKKCFLLGTSYGTRVAQVIMRDFPAMVAGVILDGVLPIDKNPFSSAAIRSERYHAAETLWLDCQQDTLFCNREYPILQTQLAQWLANPDTLIRVQKRRDSLPEMVARGYVLEALGIRLNRDSKFRMYGPAVVQDVLDGPPYRMPRTYELINLADELSSRRPGAYFTMYHCIVCHEFNGGLYEFAGTGLCAALGVAFDTLQSQRFTSDIPVLLLSSAYDTQTDPRWAARLAEDFSHSYHVLFPGIGHSAYNKKPASSCYADIVLSFIHHPELPPVTQCLEEMSGVRFLKE